MTGAVHLPRYAQALGIVVERRDGGMPVLALDYAEHVRGFPGLFHGGALGGLLEMAAVAALQTELGGPQGDPKLKPATLTVEYLRGATVRRTFARGQVVRLGRRLANVRSVAWQESEDKPVAIGFINVLLAGD